MAREHIYREVQYVVGIRCRAQEGEVEFFPMVTIDGRTARDFRGADVWTSPLDDNLDHRLAFGAAQARCDQLNADLQGRGYNRLREVS